MAGTRPGLRAEEEPTPPAKGPGDEAEVLFDLVAKQIAADPHGGALFVRGVGLQKVNAGRTA